MRKVKTLKSYLSDKITNVNEAEHDEDFLAMSLEEAREDRNLFFGEGYVFHVEDGCRTLSTLTNTVIIDGHDKVIVYSCVEEAFEIIDLM